MTAFPQTPGQAPEEPLDNFSNCHAGIVTHLHALGELPALLSPAARARQVAEETMKFFRAAVYEHHSEEERELFPAVLASAQAGSERDRVKAMVDQLTAEHRVVESTWESIEPELKKVAKGQSFEVDVEAINHLVRAYLAHAQFEEREFLPLSHTILSRNSNHMAALGLSLHMRHAPAVIGHI